MNFAWQIAFKAPVATTTTTTTASALVTFICTFIEHHLQPPSLDLLLSLFLSRSTSLNTPINCLVIAQCCAVAVAAAVAVCCCCCCAWPKVQVEVCSKKKLSLSRRRRQRSLLIQAERVASVDWALDPTMTLMLSLFSLLSPSLRLFLSLWSALGFSAAALQIYRLLSLIASVGPAKTTAITTTTTCDTHASLIYEACARTLAHCQMVKGEGGGRKRETRCLVRSWPKGEAATEAEAYPYRVPFLFTLIDACDFRRLRFVYAHLFAAGMEK